MITYVIIGLTVVISLMCFSNHALLGKLSMNPYKVIHSGEWYRLITHGFVHADMTHLFVNMFTYWSFGTYIESVFRYNDFGAWAYLGLYFGGMIVASLYDLFRYRNEPYYSSIGASGAVAAVLFSCIFLNPWDKILLFAIVPIPGILFGVLYLVYCQYMAKQGRGALSIHNAQFLWSRVRFYLSYIFRTPFVSGISESFLVLFKPYKENSP